MADILDPFVAENSSANIEIYVSNVTESLVNKTEQILKPSKDEEIGRIPRIRPILIVFGTIGNSFSFYIMRQDSLKKMSTCFYLSILALADTSKS